MGEKMSLDEMKNALERIYERVLKKYQKLKHE
jgi:hypothetical protein